MVQVLHTSILVKILGWGAVGALLYGLLCMFIWIVGRNFKPYTTTELTFKLISNTSLGTFEGAKYPLVPPALNCDILMCVQSNVCPRLHVSKCTC